MKNKTIKEFKYYLLTEQSEISSKVVSNIYVPICNELLGCDIRTKEGVEYAVENNLFTEFCPKMVESATLIAEKLIKE